MEPVRSWLAWVEGGQLELAHQTKRPCARRPAARTGRRSRPSCDRNSEQSSANGRAAKRSEWRRPLHTHYSRRVAGSCWSGSFPLVCKEFFASQSTHSVRCAPMCATIALSFAKPLATRGERRGLSSPPPPPPPPPPRRADRRGGDLSERRLTAGPQVAMSRLKHRLSQTKCTHVSCWGVCGHVMSGCGGAVCGHVGGW